MKFGERKATPIIFTGEGATLLKQIIEEGDEAVLFHDGKLVTAKISCRKGNQVLGMITWSAYERDLHPEFTTGKRSTFSQKTFLPYLK